MNSEKKCEHCGQWSAWNHNPDDKCEHCGELLSEKDHQRAENKIQREKEWEEHWMFNYKPDAPFYEKIYKKAGKFVYGIIMAITSFILWLFFWLGP